MPVMPRLALMTARLALPLQCSPSAPVQATERPQVATMQSEPTALDLAALANPSPDITFPQAATRLFEPRVAVLDPKSSCLTVGVPTSGCSTVQDSSSSIAVLEVAAKVANALNSEKHAGWSRRLAISGEHFVRERYQRTIDC